MAKHSKPAGIVFLFDVDNTLLDNDRVIADLRTFVRRELGRKQELKYWSIFEQLRSELGYADYLGALQRYRQERPREPNVLVLSQFMIDYPFANRLFPGSLDALEHANHLGRVAILSDGDVVFQPRKVLRSGLGEAVRGRVLIYVHKEEQLADVAARFPARHYVLIDDKLRILSAVKKRWRTQVTTVFVRQGHYALEPGIEKRYPAPDRILERIGDFVQFAARSLG